MPVVKASEAGSHIEKIKNGTVRAISGFVPDDGGGSVLVVFKCFFSVLLSALQLAVYSTCTQAVDRGANRIDAELVHRHDRMKNKNTVKRERA